MSLAGSIASMTVAQADGRWQRHLDDDAVDVGVGVELRGSSPSTRRLGRLALELDEPGLDADLRAAAQDLLEVDRRRRVAADDHDREPGRAAVRGRERRDVLGDGGPDLGGDRRALEEPGAGVGHRSGARGRRDRLARLAADRLARRRGEALDLVEQLHRRAVIRSPSNVGVADRRQVDHHVGGRPRGGGLAEQRGDVEVARRR